MFTGLFVVFMLLEGQLIWDRLRSHLLTREIEHSSLELDLIGVATLESLLRHDYQSVGLLVARWGEGHADIIELKAVAPNGYVLAEYVRKLPGNGNTYEAKRSISHGGQELVQLEMVGDFGQIENMLGSVLRRLLASTAIFLFGLGVVLWLSQRRMALAPLEKEIAFKDEAGKKLEESRHWLEGEVAKRTEELRQELAERKRAELEVRERQKEISLLMDSITEALYGLDTRGNCTFCNPACLRMLGYDEEKDFLGKNMHAIMHHTREDGTVYPYEECRVCDAYKEGRSVHVEGEVLWRRDGSSFPAEYWSSPVISDEGVVGAVVTFLDITKRRKAENERMEIFSTLETLVEHMPEGVFLLDAERSVVMANPVAGEYLEVVAGASVGKRIESIAGRAPVEFLISPPQILWHDVEKDGRIFEVAGRSLRDGGMVFVMRDVTKIRETDRRLRLQERLAAVGQLAAGIAHDFNNILTVISGYAEMLLDEPGLDGDARQSVNAVYQSGEKGAALIHQILDFSRQTMGETHPLDLEKFIEDFLLFIKRTIPETISISFEAGDGPYVVEADETKLQQVFANLVVNARDSMPDGGRLGIRLGLMDFSDGTTEHPMVELLGKSWVLAEVSDTGPGIADDVLPHIFEPFYTTKGSGQGTGLGLPQVYGLINQHGGKIHVDTSPLGSSFFVYLPLADRVMEEARDGEVDHALLHGKGQSVLVAEDEDAVRQLLVQLLGSMGYQVLAASNGVEALQRYKESGGGVLLAITDMVMPELDGLGLARELKKLDPELPIIAISGYTVGKGEDAMKEAGISELVRKPFKIREISRAMSRYLKA